MSFSQLRPLAFGEVLDAAFSLYRRNFGPFFTAALIAGLPVMGFWLLIASVVSSSGAGDSDSAMLVMGAVAIVTLPIVYGVQLMQWGVLTYLSSRSYTGEPVTLGTAVRRALRRFFPLALAAFISVFFISLGLLLFIVPAFILSAMFFAIAPVTVVEGRGPVEALGRSRELATGSLGRICAVMVVAFIIAALPSWGLEAFRRLYFGTNATMQLASDPWVYCMIQGISSLVQALTLPFVVAAIVVQYYDRRVRSEALDVELATQALGAPAPAGV